MGGSLYMLINRPCVHICVKMLVILVLGGEDDMLSVPELVLYYLGIFFEIFYLK